MRERLLCRCKRPGVVASALVLAVLMACHGWNVVGFVDLELSATDGPALGGIQLGTLVKLDGLDEADAPCGRGGAPEVTKANDAVMSPEVTVLESTNLMDTVSESKMTGDNKAVVTSRAPCKTGQDHVGLVKAKTHSKAPPYHGQSVYNFQSPDTCKYTMFDRPQIGACLNKRWVIFVGGSNSAGVSHGLAKLILGDAQTKFYRTPSWWTQGSAMELASKGNMDLDIGLDELGNAVCFKSDFDESECSEHVASKPVSWFSAAYANVMYDAIAALEAYAPYRESRPPPEITATVGIWSNACIKHRKWPRKTCKALEKRRARSGAATLTEQVANDIAAFLDYLNQEWPEVKFITLEEKYTDGGVKALLPALLARRGQARPQVRFINLRSAKWAVPRNEERSWNHWFGRSALFLAQWHLNRLCPNPSRPPAGFGAINSLLVGDSCLNAQEEGKKYSQDLAIKMDRLTMCLHQIEELPSQYDAPCNSGLDQVSFVPVQGRRNSKDNVATLYDITTANDKCDFMILDRAQIGFCLNRRWVLHVGASNGTAASHGMRKVLLGDEQKTVFADHPSASEVIEIGLDGRGDVLCHSRDMCKEDAVMAASWFTALPAGMIADVKGQLEKEVAAGHRETRPPPEITVTVGPLGAACVAGASNARCDELASRQRESRAFSMSNQLANDVVDLLEYLAKEWPRVTHITLEKQNMHRDVLGVLLRKIRDRTGLPEVRVIDMRSIDWKLDRRLWLSDDKRVYGRGTLLLAQWHLSRLCSAMRHRLTGFGTKHLLAIKDDCAHDSTSSSEEDNTSTCMYEVAVRRTNVAWAGALESCTLAKPSTAVVIAAGNPPDVVTDRTLVYRMTVASIGGIVLIVSLMNTPVFHRVLVTLRVRASDDTKDLPRPLRVSLPGDNKAKPCQLGLTLEMQNKKADAAVLLVSKDSAAATATATATASSKCNKMRALGMARYVASVHVVIGHLWNKNVSSEPGVRELPFPVLTTHRFGFTWVPWFMMLSGFVLTYARLNSSKPNATEPWTAFTWKRVRSIYPLYLAGLFARAAQHAILDGHAFTLGGPAETIASLLLVQAWVPTLTERVLQMHCWFLSCIIPYWALHQLAMRRLRRCRSEILVLGIFLTAVAPLVLLACVSFATGNSRWTAAYTYKGHNWESLLVVALKFTPVAYWPVYLVGIASAILLHRVRERPPFIVRYGATIGYVLLFGIFAWTARHPLPSFKLSFRMGLLAPIQALLLMGLSSNVDPVARIFSLEVLQAVENLSYPQYVFQFIAFDLWQARAGFGFWAVLVALSVAGYYFVQSPLKSSRQPTRTQAWGLLNIVMLVGVVAIASLGMRSASKPIVLPRSRPALDARDAVVTLPGGVVDRSLSDALSPLLDSTAPGTVVINPSLLWVSGRREMWAAVRLHRVSVNRTDGFEDVLWESSALVGRVDAKTFEPLEAFREIDTHRSSSSWFPCTRREYGMVRSNGTHSRTMASGVEDPRLLAFGGDEEIIVTSTLANPVPAADAECEMGNRMLITTVPTASLEPVPPQKLLQYPGLGFRARRKAKAKAEAEAEALLNSSMRDREPGLRAKSRQKNWIAFEHDGRIKFVQSIVPFTVMVMADPDVVVEGAPTTIDMHVESEHDDPNLAGIMRRTGAQFHGGTNAIQYTRGKDGARRYLAGFHTKRGDRYLNFLFEFRLLPKEDSGSGSDSSSPWKKQWAIERISKPLGLRAAGPAPFYGVSQAMTFLSGLTAVDDGVLLSYGSSNIDCRVRFVPWARLATLWDTPPALTPS